MIWNLLTGTTSTGSTGDTVGGGCTVVSFIPWLLILGAVILMWFFGKRSQQKQQDQANATLDAIQPGSRVKTIGGISGVVVEVCAEDGTFIVETGSETSGKSYIKFDRKAIYDTDAVPAPAQQPAAAEEAPVEEAPVAAEGDGLFEETPVEQAEAPEKETEGATETPAEETDAE